MLLFPVSASREEDASADRKNCPVWPLYLVLFVEHVLAPGEGGRDFGETDR